MIERFLRIVTVRGTSMAPTLHPQDRILVRVGRLPKPGEIVVFRAPDPDWDGLPWLVKRVAAGPGQALPPDLAAGRLAGERIVRDACVVMRGDNPVSQDSRQLGYVPFDAILGSMLRQL